MPGDRSLVEDGFIKVLNLVESEIRGFVIIGEDFISL